jgi:hypothetical protein
MDAHQGFVTDTGAQAVLVRPFAIAALRSGVDLSGPSVVRLRAA